MYKYADMTVANVWELLTCSLIYEKNKCIRSEKALTKREKYICKEEQYKIPIEGNKTVRHRLHNRNGQVDPRKGTHTKKRKKFKSNINK